MIHFFLQYRVCATAPPYGLLVLQEPHNPSDASAFMSQTYESAALQPVGGDLMRNKTE